MELSEIRKEIDALDEKLLPLFLERMEKCAQVAKYKKENALPVLNSGREQEILQRVREKAGSMGEYASRFFEDIMSISKDYQRAILGTWGLIGKSLPHSWSPKIHALLGCAEYKLFELGEEELGEFLKDNDIGGLNVTIPYKKTVMQYCDVLTDTARQIGSVNTLYVRDGKLIGENTDAFGLEYMIKRANIDICGKKTVIFGSGGASLTAQFVAKKLGASEVIVVSRSGENNYENLSRHYDAKILINTTPLGMFPKTGEKPAHPVLFPDCEGVIDLVYNPRRTAFILRAEELNIPCTDGLPMLVAQAARARECFTDTKVKPEKIEEIIAALRAETQNIVLVGMPGCGKSTVGAALAELSGREMIDIDAQIEKTAGCTIPEIFARDGEEKFRQLESDELEKAGKLSGKIIMTGGGAVKKEKNYDFLHQNGRIYFIERDISLLPRDGRPLSKGDLDAMYAERLPMYLRFADGSVKNNGTVEECANRIWSDFNENSRA